MVVLRDVLSPKAMRKRNHPHDAIWTMAQPPTPGTELSRIDACAIHVVGGVPVQIPVHNVGGCLYIIIIIKLEKLQQDG